MALPLFAATYMPRRPTGPAADDDAATGFRVERKNRFVEKPFRASGNAARRSAGVQLRGVTSMLRL
jgi:hypothetical protein